MSILENLLDSAYEKLSAARASGDEEKIKEAERELEEMYDAFSDM